jgi:hypothetical protein
MSMKYTESFSGVILSFSFPVYSWASLLSFYIHILHSYEENPERNAARVSTIVNTQP